MELMKMMYKSKQLNKLQKEYLSNLTIHELKSFILDLATEYYVAIVSKDKIKIQSVLNTFDNLKDIHDEKDVESYINYALIQVFNKVILKADSHINLNKPVLNPIDINTVTDLNLAVSHFESLEAMAKYEEMSESNFSEEEVKRLYNFDDYYVKTN